MHTFLTLARHGRNHWWRYLLTLLLVIIAISIGGLPASSVHPELFMDSGTSGFGIASALDVLLTVLPFAAGLAALLLAIKDIHRRPIRTVLTAGQRFRLMRFFWGAGITIVAIGLVEGVLYILDPDNYVLTFDPERTVPILLAGIALIPLQAAFEEVLLRGYIMQGISLLVRLPAVALVITAVIFSLLHGANPEMTNAAMYLPMQMFTGLLLGLVVLLDDGLEMAIGIHATNNVYSLSLVNYQGSAFATPAMFTVREISWVGSAISLIVLLLLVYLVGQKKFGWRSWQEALQRTPAAPVETEEAVDSSRV